jgi:dehydrogenase/reductase SDR family protein 1
MGNLSGQVCVVTGASRGIGKGVDAEHGDAANLPGTLITHVCDHRDDTQTEDVMRAVLARHGRIDILVNNAWGGYERMEENNEFTWIRPFWQQPAWRWDAMFAAGVRPAFVAAQAAASAMVAQRSGLIVNISFWAAQKHMGNAIYGIAKAAADKMAADMAHELRPHNVAAVALYPGLVRTEAVLRNAQHFDMSNSESPQFIGRVIAELYADPQLMQKSGKVLVAAALAEEYGVADIDGKRPRPATLETP